MLKDFPEEHTRNCNCIICLSRREMQLFEQNVFSVGSSLSCMNNGKQRTIFYFHLHKKQLLKLFQRVKKDSLEVCMSSLAPFSFFFFLFPLRFSHFVNPDFPLSFFFFLAEEAVLSCLWQSRIIRSVEKAGDVERRGGREGHALSSSSFLSLHPALLSF